MNVIKEYKEQVLITTFDGEIIGDYSILALDKLIGEKPDFIKIGDRRIARHQIKYYEPQTIEMNSIDEFIKTLHSETQKKVREREKEKKMRVGRGFDSVEEIQNYIKDKGLAIK